VSIADEPDRRRREDHLDDDQRRVARALRHAAAVVAAAALPADYRPAAFRLVAELELDALDLGVELEPLAA
jgi:hypothetical protein